LKRERILLAMAGLLLGFVVSGCREPNPAYIKADGAVTKDTALPEDRAQDTAIPDTNIAPRDTTVLNDASIDARDAPVDRPGTSDRPDSRAVPGDALNDGGEVADALAADGPGATLDVLPDTMVLLDADERTDRPHDIPGSLDATDGPSIGRDDSGVPILDGQILDTSLDEPGVAVDAPQATDAPAGDASDDGGAEPDGDTPDTTL
jgi:hypothetical protein